MKIIIQGLWHLGLVHAAGLYKFKHKIYCYSNNHYEIEKLNRGELPIYEKDLSSIINNAKSKNKIIFTSNISKNNKSRILWYCLDTPINKNDVADVKFVLKEIYISIKNFKNIKYLIISSQIPIGTVKKIEKFIKKNYLDIDVIYIPENLRLGSSIKNFIEPDRLIVGTRSDESFRLIQKIFLKIKNKIVRVSPESAELIKHSINGFLALSICYINEITRIAKRYSSNPLEIEKGLKSEERIGHKSYLSPGNAFAGGTLGRDVNLLNKISRENKLDNSLIGNILKSNKVQKDYIYQNIKKFKKKKIVIVGLSYKEGTSTLRQSDSIKLANWLKKNNYKFYLYDSQIDKIPKTLEKKVISNLEKKIKDIDIYIFLYKQKKIKNLNKNILKHRNNKKTYFYDPCHNYPQRKEVIYI